MAHPARILAAVILAASPVLATDQADATDASDSAAAATSPSGSWTVARAQTIRNSNLIVNSVTVPAVGDVWAVGYRYGTVGGATEFRTVIEHLTSTGDFQLVPSPDREGAPAVNFLRDISGSSPTDLWTVGRSRDPAQRNHTLIEHWDGTSWTFATSPDPGPYGDILQGVTSIAADDAWAVGARQDGFYQSPLTEHWDGSTWSPVAAPDPALCSGHSCLTDVTTRSVGDVWATGTCTSSSKGGDQGYFLH